MIAPVKQEPDRIPTVWLLGLTALTVCVSALGVLTAYEMLRRDPASHPVNAPVSSAALGPGTPERTPIEATERGIALRRAQRKELETYGWVDRDAGIAHIPIERALDLRAQGVR